VFGSQRSNVSRYDRRTAQTTLVGPDLSVTLPGGGAVNRNVRTMPLHFSPVDNSTMYYAQNVVWKSTDGAHSWTRISPDLTRPTWEVPATAGKYTGTVRVAPAGSITALSPSPRSLGVIWVGTDDGQIQTTSDGGTTWRNVTPTGMKPWARIFNIEAGHFDTRTAYAAANTLRLDDINPHFLRTRDGGATWTEITTGIAGGAVANAIREDPRQKGLPTPRPTCGYGSLSTTATADAQGRMPPIGARPATLDDRRATAPTSSPERTGARLNFRQRDATPAGGGGALGALVKRCTSSAGLPRVRFGTNEPTAPEMHRVTQGLIDYYLPATPADP
jgi:hypothetical protein